MLRLSTREFERLVAEALDTLPDELWEAIDNVEVTVAPYPTGEQLRRAGVTNGTLLGLYEGIPLTERNSGYTFVLPDKITIFQRPIERICGCYEEIVAQVRETVIHEVAHHFGIDDARLDELGWD
jgi:predicted Zn-dependent protease with MMP-like domain